MYEISIKSQLLRKIHMGFHKMERMLMVLVEILEIIIVCMCVRVSGQVYYDKQNNSVTIKGSDGSQTYAGMICNMNVER